MIIYKDLFTGDEIGSDSYPIKLIDDTYYEIDGKRISRKLGIDNAAIGANPSEEDGGGDDVEEAVESGINIVLTHELMELEDWDKKAYISYAKKYMKNLVAKIEEQDGAEKAAELKGKLQKCFTDKIVPNLKNFQYFVGPNFEEKGMVILLNYREDGITPYFIYFKDGLVEEKM